eukprot:1760359-Rhodomonas_salina.1
MMPRPLSARSRPAVTRTVTARRSLTQAGTPSQSLQSQSQSQSQSQRLQSSSSVSGPFEAGGSVRR